MDVLQRIAETKLAEAAAAGELDPGPSVGRPLRLEDHAGVPPELRAAYGLLKQANVLPEELELHQSLVRLRSLLEACEAGDERARLEREHRDLALRYELLLERRRGRPLGAYHAAVLRRLMR